MGSGFRKKGTKDGKLTLDHSKKINDFGNGFYCGESLEQSAMFVAAYLESADCFFQGKTKGIRKYRGFEIMRRIRNRGKKAVESVK